MYADTPYENLANSDSGDLPDGIFNDSVTRFEFCCREDGFASDSIEFPTSKPFALFKYGSDCQKVTGMRDKRGKFSFDNYNGGNYSCVAEGDNPITFINRENLYYWTHHCHYTPLNMDCGDVIELTAANPSAVISSQGGTDLECNWLIKAPGNDRVLLSFANFSVLADNQACVDSVELRYSRLGQPGLIHCGESFVQSITSIYNSMMLTFRTVGASSSFFTATVSLVDDDDSCYRLDDQGATYNGRVNYTHDFKPCLYWSEVQHCPHHRFADEDLNDNLQENYCRNPGDGHMPWCYTDSDGCQRNYCDVCLVEPPYDIYQDCVQLKATGYCTSNPEAISMCAKTCQNELLVTDTPVKVSEIRCGVPEVLLDGAPLFTPKDSYSIGEVFTYKCITSDATVDVTCLSDGHWSAASHTCRDCPDGWYEYKGYCYGYIDQLGYYSAAQTICAGYNAIVATAKDEEESDLLQHIRSLKAPDTPIWLGMTDVVLEGQWIWTDGDPVSWTNWMTGQPDNWYDAEHCALMKKDGQWNDVYCGAYYTAAVICKAPTFDSPCQDFWEDCPVLFYDDPTICTTYPYVAKMMCEYTCGFCGPTEPVCDVEPATDNTTLVTQMTSIAVGDYVTYACKDGYHYSSGDENRGCQWCNEMSGEPYVCVGPDQIVTVMDSAPLIRRNKVPDAERSITGDTDYFRITKHGKIVAWEFYSNYPGDVAFQVWRKSPENGANYFQYVAQNKVYTRNDMLMIVDVPESERIVVQPGDLIGAYYGTQKGGVAFDWCDGANYPEAMGATWLVTKQSNPDNFVSGQVYQFGSWFSCRLFSFRAHIGP